MTSFLDNNEDTFKEYIKVLHSYYSNDTLIREYYTSHPFYLSKKEYLLKHYYSAFNSILIFSLDEFDIAINDYIINEIMFN